jgi:hypothetical protein
MIAAAVVALVCAGLFAGSPRVAAGTFVCLLMAPFAVIFYVLAKRLGLNTLFR